jgi:hypothetical protein
MPKHAAEPVNPEGGTKNAVAGGFGDVSDIME